MGSLNNDGWVADVPLDAWKLAAAKLAYMVIEAHHPDVGEDDKILNAAVLLRGVMEIEGVNE